MKKERKSENFLPKPTYPGGPRKMSAFIRENLKYPKDALESKTEGTVRIRIEIDYKGDVVGSQVLSSVSTACDKEAKRVVSLMKFKVGHKLRKGKIRFHKTLNIRFVFPKLKKVKEKTRINYTILKPKKAALSKKAKPETTTYTYTITYSEG